MSYNLEGAEIRTSSRCDSGSCVGVMATSEVVLLLDVQGGKITPGTVPIPLAPPEYSGFIDAVKAGNFDMPATQ